MHFCSNQILSVQRYTRIVVNKKYKLIQVMGTLYRYLSNSAFTCSKIYTVIYLFIVLLSCTCIFERTVLIGISIIINSVDLDHDC